jgi:hypothetical protein
VEQHLLSLWYFLGHAKECARPSCLLVEVWEIKERYNMEDGAYMHFLVYLERETLGVLRT